jgi:hypothetical protein
MGRPGKSTVWINVRLTVIGVFALLSLDKVVRSLSILSSTNGYKCVVHSREV